MVRNISDLISLANRLEEFLRLQNSGGAKTTDSSQLQILLDRFLTVNITDEQEREKIDPDDLPDLIDFVSQANGVEKLIETICSLDRRVKQASLPPGETLPVN